MKFTARKVEMTDILWDRTIDRGKYRVRIEGEDAYRGELIVTQASDDLELLREPVLLTFGSVMGPDADDKAEWQRRAVKAVDDFETRSSRGKREKQTCK